MSRILDLKVLEKAYEKDRCESLLINFPKAGISTRQLRIPLNRLYEQITTPRFFEGGLSVDEIETVCLFGSSLYKHFPERFKEGLFGYVKEPRDIDLMVITSKSSDGKKVIIPERNLSWENYRVKDFALFEKVNAFDMYGPSTQTEDLHITYRSKEQFIKGVESSLDVISESVVRQGLPLFNREKFYDILKKIKKPIERRELHSLSMEQSIDGKLSGRVI